MLARDALIRRVLVLTMATCFIGFSGQNNLAAQQIDTQKVATFHAPKSFFQVLAEIQDGEQRVITTTTQWFSAAEADAWVVLHAGPSDMIALPELAQKVVDAVAASPNPLTRVNVKFAKRETLPIQVNNIEKTDKTVQFQGCIAAVDVYSAFSDNNAEVFEQLSGICDRYDQ